MSVQNRKDRELLCKLARCIRDLCDSVNVWRHEQKTLSGELSKLNERVMIIEQMKCSCHDVNDGIGTG